jgi:hypothetical protein
MVTLILMVLTLRTQQRIARALAAWCLVFLIVLAGRPSFTNASIAVRGVTDPVIALQMARTSDEVEAILGEAPSADREVMRVKQYIDFALIAGYFTLALLIAAALTRSGRRWSAALLSLLTIVAASLDVRENLFTLRIVNLNLNQLTPAMLASLRFTSTAKWIALTTAMSLIATVSVERRRWQPRAAGLVSLAGVSITLAGLFYPALFAWGGLLMLLGLLAAAVTLKELTYESAP